MNAEDFTAHEDLGGEKFNKWQAYWWNFALAKAQIELRAKEMHEAAVVLENLKNDSFPAEDLDRKSEEGCPSKVEGYSDQKQA